MRRGYITSAFAGALLLGLTTAALAVTGEFDNMCTQGLVSGKEVKTDCSINTTLDGTTYCFGNEATTCLARRITDNAPTTSSRAKIAVARLGDASSPLLAASRVLLRRQPDPCRYVARRAEGMRIRDTGNQGGRD
jgi:hypothetical protein